MSATYTVSDSSIQKRQKVKKKNRNSSFKRVVALFSIIFVLCMTGFSTITVAGNALIDESQIEQLQHEGRGSTPQSYVSIGDMPDYVGKAFIAIEDQHFMSHFGIDPVGLARSLWTDVKVGGFAEGGSTITMQLARNLFLSSDKTIIRKLKEMVIAVNLERQYSKTEILEMYLNDIYFGHGKYGIEQAAQFYFGKTVRADKNNTITIGEAAMLAALPKAPEYYSPIKYPKKAKERQEIVLDQMEKAGFITKTQRASALKEKMMPTAS